MLAYSDIAEIDNCLSEQVGYSLADYITFVDCLIQTSIDNNYDICGLDLNRFVINWVGSEYLLVRHSSETLHFLSKALSKCL